MNKYADLIDTLCCHIFGMTSIAGGLWFYWELVIAPPMLL